MQRIPETPPKILPLPDDTKRPLWSVMIPTYNCSSFIPYVICSVLKQNIPEDQMQIEVIDDCSSDADVGALVKRLGKGRIGFFRHKTNVGSLRNFETCINRAKGKYVHILHGDDGVEFNFYTTIGSLFEQFPQAGAAFTNFSFIDPENNKVQNSNKKLLVSAGIIRNFLYKIAKRQLIQPPAIVVKREVYENVGSFFAAHFGEDWEMWSRIASRYPIAYSPETLACYRVANGSGISHNSFQTGQNIKDIIKIIDIIGGYLPEGSRKQIKDYALAYYSIYCVKVANSLLPTYKKAAFIQARGAVQMHRNFRTIYWFCRFYLMYFLRYKELQTLTYKVWGKPHSPSPSQF